MENLYYSTQQQQDQPQLNPFMQKNPPVFDEFLAGDSPENLPETSPEASPQECVSDCESGVSGGSSLSSTSSSGRRRGGFPEKLAVELNDDDRAYDVIRRRFVSGLGAIGDTTTVTAIHRRNWSDFPAQAKLQSFQIHSRAVASKHGGSPNVKFAWHGGGSRERIEKIISNGFSYADVMNSNNGAVFLSPDHAPADSVEGSVVDEEGLRHVLLCRVILGRPELVEPGSGQTYPSSDEFDSGVDDFDNPKKYIIWSTNMNSHILPEYIVSFRISAPTPSFPRDSSRMGNATKMRMPASPWISFPMLIAILAKFLPQNAISLINKFHKDYKEKRLTRTELIQKVRQIAGDKLLVAVIKSYKGAKELKTSMGFLRNREY